MLLSDPFIAALQECIEVFMRHSMRNLIHSSREKGLSMSQVGALFFIHRTGSRGVTDLGDHLGVTSGAASQMLERLVQQDLILRAEDPHDRRLKQIRLTPKGRRTLHESIQARQGWLEELAENMTPCEKDQVTKALHILIDRTRQLEGISELENE